MKTLTNNNDFHEIEGVPGVYKFTPMKVMYEFRYNENFMYCINFDSGKILKERRFYDYENNDKKTISARTKKTTRNK